jgi:hypothetical protein
MSAYVTIDLDARELHEWNWLSHNFKTCIV